MQTNKIIEFTAYAVGGIALFMASLLVFALAAGVPAHQVAIVGGLFPEPPPMEMADASEDEDGEVVRPKIGPRSIEDVIDSTIARLPTQGGTSPFEDKELGTLIDKMKQQNLQLSRDLELLEARESKVAERDMALDERKNLLDDLMAQLSQREADIKLQQEELQRDQIAKDESDAERWTRVAQAFMKGKPDELIGKLIVYGPQDAARILANLTPDSASKLLNELDGQEFKEFNDAYSLVAE